MKPAPADAPGKPADAPGRQPSPKVRILFQLIALALVFVAHASYIDAGFTWLDHGDIEQKSAVMPLDQVHRALLDRYEVVIEPFTETEAEATSTGENR